MRAIDFLSKLDPKRYTAMLTVMRNNAVQNLPNSYPNTLAGAFRVASSWTNTHSLVPLGGEQHSAYLTDSAFVSKSKEDKVKEKDPQTRGKVSGGRKDRRSSPSTIICFVCGKGGHYARDCENKKDGETALLTTEDHSDDEEEAYNVFKSEGAYVTSSETVLFSPSHVLLDNQASVNIFKNPHLLTNIRVADNGILLNGVQQSAAGVRVDQIGDFNEVGPVYFSKEASANILSFAAMEDAGSKIRYDHSRAEFTLQPVNSSRIYIFKRQPMAGGEGRFFVCDMRDEPTHEVALVSTVAENMSRYTKREIASAAKARELLARMGYPSIENAVAMLRNGNNFEVVEQDFKIAQNIWGGCLATMKGKQHRYKTRTADIRVVPSEAQKQQILAVDIMFIDSTPSLVAVATPLDMTFASSLGDLDLQRPSRSASAVKRGLDEVLSVLSSRNFTVSLIMTDGEGAMGALKQYLNFLGVEVDVSGAGGHVARVERKIQMIKERVRVHVCGRLPFTLTTNGLSMLILYCVSRLNYQQSGSRPGGLTPRELFTGRRVDGSKDFRAAFGDYAICTVPKTDNSMKSRTEDCIVMLPTGNRTGTVKMLSLATGKIVSRDQFKVLPMPLSVINTLNQMAIRDGKKIMTPPNVMGELLYSNSVSQSNMPTYVLNPPSQDPAPAQEPMDIQPPQPPILLDDFIGLGGLPVVNGPALPFGPSDNSISGSTPALAQTQAHTTDTDPGIEVGGGTSRSQRRHHWTWTSTHGQCSISLSTTPTDHNSGGPRTQLGTH